MSNIYNKTLSGINYIPNLTQINASIETTFGTGNPPLPITSSTMSGDTSIMTFSITIVFGSNLSAGDRTTIDGLFINPSSFSQISAQFFTNATGACGNVSLVCDVNGNNIIMNMPPASGSTLATVNSIQQLSNKIINANCNSITNLTTTLSGILPVVQGGTGYSSLITNGVLLGNNSSTPTFQTLNGDIVDLNSNQSLANKVINENTPNTFIPFACGMLATNATSNTITSSTFISFPTLSVADTIGTPTWYNISTSRFTAPRKGVYSVIANIKFEMLVLTGNTIFTIINPLTNKSYGNVNFISSLYSLLTQNSIQVSATCLLNVGNQIGIQYTSSNFNSIKIQGGISLSIYFLYTVA